MQLPDIVKNGVILESIPKIGFWFKIPSSPFENHGFAETGAAGQDFKPQVRLRRIEDLKRGTNPPKRRETKRHF